MGYVVELAWCRSESRPRLTAVGKDFETQITFTDENGEEEQLCGTLWQCHSAWTEKVITVRLGSTDPADQWQN